jgi:mannose-6-phosphate isomerase-like protein (cupin superfamily)
MVLTRRDICVLLPALMATVPGHSTQTHESSNQALESTIYDFKGLSVQKSEGHDYIPVFEGNTYSGMHITLHETGLGPGAVAHSVYRHSGDEMFLVREGTLEVEIGGKRSELGPGSVAYVASNAEYAIRNTSHEWTRYFVLLFGPSHPHIQWG